MHVVAALVENPTAVCEHKLYWGTVTNRAEGLYLCSLLNNPLITHLVRPHMSYGKDERDIDKYIWKLPIPLYDALNPTHRRLSDLGEHCTDLVAGLDLGDSGNFVSFRRKIRSILAADPTAIEINELMLDLLST